MQFRSNTNTNAGSSIIKSFTSKITRLELAGTSPVVPIQSRGGWSEKDSRDDILGYEYAHPRDERIVETPGIDCGSNAILEKAAIPSSVKEGERKASGMAARKQVAKNDNF